MKIKSGTKLPKLIGGLFFVPLLLFLNNSYVFSQKRTTIWCFGDSAGVDFNNLINPQPITSSVHAGGSCISIADSAGNLLFYANTGNKNIVQWLGYETEVWRRDNMKMQNGDSLVGQDWYQELLIIPKSFDDSLYYIFTFCVLPNSGLQYSVVDCKADNTYGAIIQKNIFVNSGINFIDAIVSVKHANGRDWWLLAHGGNNNSNSNTFYEFLVTPDSVFFYNQQSIGSFHNSGLGKMKFSPDGSKILTVNYYGLIEVLNFDRCTGILDSVRTISSEDFSNPKRYFGCSFSPSGQLIYVSNTDNIFGGFLRLLQYNLLAPDITASKKKIYISQVPASGGMHLLAPNGKIYISCLYEYGFPYPDSIHNIYSDNLSVINNPDSLGIACDFQPFSFYLGGKRTYWGLPNNPDYDMGVLAGSPCDTLTDIQTTEVQESKSVLFLFYHSGWQKLFVNAQRLKGRNCLLQVFDINGKNVFSSTRKTQPPYFTHDVNCKAFKKGIYIVKLQTEKEQLVKKFVKN